MQVLVSVQLFLCIGGGWEVRGSSISPPHHRHRPSYLRNPPARMGSGDGEWSFRVLATIKPCVYNATETIGAIAFDSSNEFMATGGIARKIRVYKLDAILEEDDELCSSSDDELGPPRSRRRSSTLATRTFDTDRCSASVICTPSRLSSLQWKPGSRAGTGNILCGDYDGVLTEWSIERQCTLLERYEHSGRHVWSVEYAKDESERSISASDDGTARVWHSGMESSACIVSSPRLKPVCCAEFDPRSGNRIALACADSNVYVHDLRRPELPLWTLVHHRRAASYARFLSEERLVSASVDSRICVWDLAGASSLEWGTASPYGSPRVVESFSAHRNVKNFVGLSVWRRENLIACGSETNEAFVYQSGRGGSVLQHRFTDSSSSLSSIVSNSRGSPSSSRSFPPGLVSAVSWMHEQPDSSRGCTLAAANSDGVLQLLSGNVKDT